MEAEATKHRQLWLKYVIATLDTGRACRLVDPERCAPANVQRLRFDASDTAWRAQYLEPMRSAAGFRVLPASEPSQAKHLKNHVEARRDALVT